MVYFKELMSEAKKSSKQLGDIGEKIVSQYLERKDYKILDRNYSPRWVSGPLRGEIDIIAEKEKTISFIEVKTLKDNLDKGFSPEQKVNQEKQKRILKTAESWLMEKKIPLDSKWQIDVVSVEINSDLNKAKIRHFQNAIFYDN
jgi:putative endonuclease